MGHKYSPKKQNQKKTNKQTNKKKPKIKTKTKQNKNPENKFGISLNILQEPITLLRCSLHEPLSLA